MPDLPDRRKREDELAAVIAAALHQSQGQWLQGLAPNLLNHNLDDAAAAVLMRSFQGSAEGTAEQLGIAVGGAPEAAAGWSSIMGVGVALAVGASVQRTVSRLPNELSRTGIVDAVMGSGRWGTIAATEVTRAATAGSEYVASTWVTLRGMLATSVWHTNSDARVCPICAPMDGLAQEVWSRILPGGPPAHPNCVLPGQVVVAPGQISGATQAFYNGPCVQVRSRHGRRLSVTENHPVLTRRGWVPAKLLRVGEHIFHGARPERIAAAVDPNHDHRPSLIEQVFCAAMVAAGMRSGSMPLSAEDFHGDARFINGQVDVVNPLGFLHRHGQPSTSQPAYQPAIGCPHGNLPQFAGSRATHALINRRRSASRSRMGWIKHLLASGLVGPLPSRFHRVGNGSALYASAFQSKPQAAAIDSQFSGQGLFRLTSHVSRDDRPEAGNCQVSSDRPNLDPSLNEHSAQPLVGDPGYGREFVNRFAGLIAEDQIVEINSFRYRGHVYDLQVDPGQLYFCNGIIIHNCRCWLDYSWLSRN